LPNSCFRLRHITELAYEKIRSKRLITYATKIKSGYFKETGDNPVLLSGLKYFSYSVFMTFPVIID